MVYYCGTPMQALLAKNMSIDKSVTAALAAANDPAPECPVAICLLEISVHRSKKALEQLFTLMGNKIFHFAYKQVGDESTATEVVQDTMMAAWQKGHTYDKDKAKATTWIYTIARNLCYDLGRRKLARPQLVCADDIYESAISHDDDNPEIRSSALDKDKIIGLLDSLSIEQRQIVTLVCLQDHTHNEVAQLLQLPLGTVKSRLRLGLEKLANTLNSRGLGYDTSSS